MAASATTACKRCDAAPSCDCLRAFWGQARRVNVGSSRGRDTRVVFYKMLIDHLRSDAWGDDMEFYTFSNLWSQAILRALAHAMGHRVVINDARKTRVIRDTLEVADVTAHEECLRRSSPGIAACDCMKRMRGAGIVVQGAARERREIEWLLGMVRAGGGTGCNEVNIDSKDARRQKQLEALATLEGYDVAYTRGGVLEIKVRETMVKSASKMS